MTAAARTPSTTTPPPTTTRGAGAVAGAPFIKEVWATNNGFSSILEGIPVVAGQAYRINSAR